MTLDFLKKDFEESLEFNLENDQLIRIGESTFTPLDVLKNDQTAYDEEYLRWFDQIWVKKRLFVLDQILQIYDNESEFDTLCNSFSSKRLIPFVGAGMSIPTGMPSWKKFLIDLCPRTRIPVDEIKKMLGRGAFEDAASAQFSEMPDKQFNRIFHNRYRKLDTKPIVGPIKFLPDLFQNLIITTNFDNILEELYKSCDLDFKHILKGQSIDEYRLHKVDSGKFLLKIHGDYRIKSSRVLTKEEYDRFYAKDSVAIKELSLIISNNNLLFIGCSLTNDRTMKLLKKLADHDENFSNHYAFLLDPKNERKLLAREKILSKCNIFPIWYQEEHNSSIEALFIGMLKRRGDI